MKKIFLDTNFIMDLLARGPEYSSIAKRVLEKGLVKDYQFYVSFLSVANFAYITRKGGNEKLRENIHLICDLFEVLPNTKENLKNAWEYNPQDYDDALQYATAISIHSDCIISRDNEDFKFSEIPVLSPAEFLERLDEER